MTAAKRKAPPPKTPKKTSKVAARSDAAPVADETGALERALAAEAELEALRDQIADREDDGDDDVPSVTYNPLTHLVISHADHSALLHAKTKNDDHASKVMESIGLQQEKLFSGFTHISDISAKQRDADLAFGNNQREEADKQRKRVSELEREIAEMVRQSEEAQLARKRMDLEVHRMEHANSQQAADYEYRIRMHDAQMRTVGQLGAPAAAALANGLMKIVQQYAPSILGSIGASPSGGAPNGGLPTGPPPPDAGVGIRPPQPEAEVYALHTETWKVALLDVLNACGPESLACLRALTASNLLAAYNVPPVPSVVTQNLFGLIQRDAGGAKISALLRASSMAYCSEATQAADRTTPTAGPAASGPMN